MLILFSEDYFFRVIFLNIQILYHPHPLLSSFIILILYYPCPLSSLSLIILTFILIWRIIGWNLGGKVLRTYPFQRWYMGFGDSAARWVTMKVPKLMGGLLKTNWTRFFWATQSIFTHSVSSYSSTCFLPHPLGGFPSWKKNKALRKRRGSQLVGFNFEPQKNREIHFLKLTFSSWK